MRRSGVSVLRRMWAEGARKAGATGGGGCAVGRKCLQWRSQAAGMRQAQGTVGSIWHGLGVGHGTRSVGSVAGEQEGRETTARLPVGYWDAADNQRRFMDKVAAKYNVQAVEDWKRVQNKDVVRMGGAGLLARFDSFGAALRQIYPEKDIKETECRAQMPRGHWKVKENRIRFVKELADAFGVREAKDWQRVRYKDVLKHPGGRGFLGQYPSFYAALKDCITDPKERQDVTETEELDMFLVRQTSPQGFWQEEENIKQLVAKLEDELGLEKPADWYRVSYGQLRALRAAPILSKGSKLLDALKLAYPKEVWDADKLASRKKKAGQRQLLSSVGQLLR